jgi:hypothetical protein
MNTFRLTPFERWRPAHDAYVAEMRARAGAIMPVCRDRLMLGVDNVLSSDTRFKLLEPLAVYRDGGRPLTWAHVRRLDQLAHLGWPAPIGGRYLLTGEGQAFDCTLGEALLERSQLWEIVRSALREAMTGEGCSQKQVEAEMRRAGFVVNRSQLSRVLSGQQLRIPIEILDGILRVCGQSLPWALTAA